MRTTSVVLLHNFRRSDAETTPPVRHTGFKIRESPELRVCTQYFVLRRRQEPKLTPRVAAAETLRSLYSHGKEALHKPYGLLAVLGLGLGVGLLRTSH